MLQRASLFLLLAALPSLAGPAGEARPAFAPGQQTQVVAALGGVGALDCTVLRLADKAVSWVRSRDLQILAHAGAAFTADARVAVAADGGRHSLRIERLRAADAGRYECQVNTEPKMSLLFNLTVVDEPEPAVVVEALRAEVAGAAGGAATLECVARLVPAPVALPAAPLDLRWSRRGRPVDLQSARGGVSLHTERWAARAHSRLTLAELRASDAGEYTCAAAGRAAVLRLAVDELGAEAMQRDQAAPARAARPVRAGALLAVLAALLLRAPPACWL